MNTIRVYGERLRDARVVQGLLSKDVADRATMAPSQLTRLERSAYTDVNSDTAERLARALAFPLAFFSFAPTAVIQPGTTFFKARKTMTKREEEQLHTWSRLAGQILVSVLSEVTIPNLKLPTKSDFHDARSAAEATRKAFGVDQSSPIPHVVRTIERGGIPVVSLDFDADIAKHDAFCCWVSSATDIQSEWPVMVIRTVDSWERTRFSGAHELGHLVMHRNGAPTDDVTEQEAHDFARHFLLPEDVLHALWPSIPTLNAITQIKAQYGISLSAIIEHAWRVGLIDDHRRISFYKQLSNRKDAATGLRWREREPGWQDRQAERPRLVARMLEAARGDGFRLNDVSPSVGFWPALYLRRTLVGQIWSDEKSRDKDQSSRVLPMTQRGG